MTPVPEVMPVNINSNGRGHLKLAHSIRSLASAQWLESAATGAAHVSAANLRLENRKRKGDADTVFAGAAGAGRSRSACPTCSPVENETGRKKFAS